MAHKTGIIAGLATAWLAVSPPAAQAQAGRVYSAPQGGFPSFTPPDAWMRNAPNRLYNPTYDSGSNYYNDPYYFEHSNPYLAAWHFWFGGGGHPHRYESGYSQRGIGRQQRKSVCSTEMIQDAANNYYDLMYQRTNGFQNMNFGAYQGLHGRNLENAVTESAWNAANGLLGCNDMDFHNLARGIRSDRDFNSFVELVATRNPLWAAWHINEQIDITLAQYGISRDDASRAGIYQEALEPQNARKLIHSLAATMIYGDRFDDRSLHFLAGQAKARLNMTPAPAAQ